MATHLNSWLRKVIGVQMTAEAHLIDTKWFRAAIAVPITIALLVGWYFSGDIHLQLDRSPEGMNHFLKMFKLPIGIAGLALPIVAVIAANHKSMQTAKQIEEQNAQNIFSNHLEHRDFFSKFIDERKPFDKISIDTARLYEALFPKAVEGDLKPNTNLLNEILTEISETLFSIYNVSEKQLNRKSFRISQDSANLLQSKIQLLEKLLNHRIFSIPSTDTKKLFYEPIDVIREARSRFLTIACGIVKAANFHRYYVKQEQLSSTLDLCKKIETLLGDLHEVYNFYTSIKLATDEYLDHEGNIKLNDGKTPFLFLQRLADIDKSMQKNNISIEPIKLIFEHHIDKKHRIPLHMNAPEDWQNHLKLSEQEREEMLRIKFNKS